MSDFPLIARAGLRLALAAAWSALIAGRLPAADLPPPAAPAPDQPAATPAAAASDLSGAPLQLDKVEVTARQRAFSNAIDRKIYSVGGEIQSSTGSAADLLQNIPSVEVDLDGNVSLRGSDSVTILIDGRKSTLMGKNRADALAQLPADSIDKIEVITNPSAKYSPDGTGGIINLTLKKQHRAGFSGSVNAMAGNNRRANAGVVLSYGTGPLTLSAAASVRQDDRPRRFTDVRTITDPGTGLATTLAKTSVEESRPLSRLFRASLDYRASAHDRFGLATSAERRTFWRTATDRNVTTDPTGAPTGDYDRNRIDPEIQRTDETSATYQHVFPEPGHELNVEIKTSLHQEQEDNRYTDVFRLPVQPATFDRTLIQPDERETEASADYAWPIDANSKLEAGYNRSDDRLFTNFAIAAFNPATGRFENDPTKSNRFRLHQTIDAAYVTYAHTLGRFSFLAGLRPEQARIRSLLVDTGQTIPQDYFRVYPSLHLTFQAAPAHQFQLNYSHRVRRPESDDLNPFPEYSDPFTLRAGNPYLKPEETHSVEAGYQFQSDRATFVATVYHRYTYNDITPVTRDLGHSVLLTTHENLSSNRATGLELAATADLGPRVSVNFSSNTFFNTVDASNLGFTGAKADVSWSAKLGVTMRMAQHTTVQANTRYSSARLTAQGSRAPVFVANVGLRHELRPKQLALIVTVSDLFNSLKESTLLDTPALREEVSRRRSSRIVYAGLVWTFGQSAKKPKDDTLKFDEQL